MCRKSSTIVLAAAAASLALVMTFSTGLAADEWRPVSPAYGYPYGYAYDYSYGCTYFGPVDDATYRREREACQRATQHRAANAIREQAAAKAAAQIGYPDVPLSPFGFQR